MNPSQKTTLIIGGASGIGKVAADMLIDQGCQPLVIDQDMDALEKCQSEWRDKARVFPMDLTNPHEVRRALAWAECEAGMLDAVVITAAIHNTHPIEYLPNEMIDQVINVNLVSHIRFVRDVIPLLRPGGRIIAVTSVSAEVGIPMESLYSASKAGLDLFYECMNIELAYKNIRCITIQPGNVNTGFNEKGNNYHPTGNAYIDTMYRKIGEQTNSQYGISPDKVARAIVKSIKAPKPRLCVRVGGNAIKAHWAKRILGRDMAQKVLKKAMHL